MAIRDWFKSPTQRAVEAEASIPASVRRAIIQAAHNERSAYQSQRIQEELDHQTAAFTRSPDEAKAYHFALDLVRRRGPSEASRIADRVVFFVQMLSREPR